VRLLVVTVAARVLAAPALATEERPTVDEVASEVMCPTCAGETVAQSSAPASLRIKSFIATRIEAGDTKSEIKAKLVADYGERILASPPKRGFNLLAWVLPFAGVGLGVLAVGLLAWRWSRARGGGEDAPVPDASSNGHGGLDPELERRLDEALARYDG